MPCFVTAPCQGFVVRPGHENLVAMTAVNTIADPAIRYHGIIQ